MSDPWSALAGIGAVLAVGVAVWAVIVAHRANDRADESNRIAAESLAVAEDAHALNERLAPAAWSQAEKLDNNVIRFTNQSGRHLVVTALRVTPDLASLSVQSAERPFRVEHGDAFAVGFSYSYSSARAQRLFIAWRSEDGEIDEQVTERAL